MKKLAMGALMVGLMACGGGGGSSSTVIVTDTGGGGDVGPATCNPLTQTGCNASEKCTWIEDQENPPIGHVGCAPEAAAPKAIGAACTPPPPGPMGYDDCAKGSVCLAGVCKQICDVMGGAPTCDENHSCTRYADFFEVGGNAVAGVCDPGCDPLTQDLKIGTNKVACGSPTGNMPNSGCYGYDDYSCAPVGPTTLTLLDRDPPRTNASGNPYLNGCAPGFIPFFYEMTGSTTTLCSGYCSALEIDSTQPNNNQGNATALAKMPADAAPVAGHGVCSAIYKGSSANSSCRFMYPYVEDDMGNLPLAFEQGPYLDTLGICFEYTQFNYDHDMNTQTPNMPYPNCATLPKRSGTTTGDADDAADWGCQKRANSMFADDGKLEFNAALKQVRMPKQAPMELVRHSFN
jgi:hypothetical protein